jgi:hypothetical protein
MGHQVPNLRPREIGERESLKVLEEAVSQCLLHPARCSQKEVSPNIPKTSDTCGEDENLYPIKEELVRRDYSRGEIVNGILHNSRDEKLENIDNE